MSVVSCLANVAGKSTGTHDFEKKLCRVNFD